ncbi:MAG TPA: DUF92 domain-containing protein [Gemmatimonadaceae bacterium]|nr:DUF92 domain-containing protein [Gemmatimonadaceae bacterium]
MPLLLRLAIGLALATAVALAARRWRALDGSGAVAAALVGTLAVGAGWGWGVLLVAFFAGSTALSRLGDTRKALRTIGIVAKGGERDAWQVLANGAAFAVAALGQIVAPHPLWLAAGAGALAAASADTWATEIGTLSPRAPRSIVTWRAVPVGTSGGVSAAGSAAALGGALLVGVVALAVGARPMLAGAAVLAGVAGAAADSLLGATVQAHRRCPRCGTGTERIVHPCGERSHPSGGVSWIDNDVVNLLATTIGALAAVAIAA